MWEAAQRLKRYEKAGKDTLVIHLGDHDPSGLDMTRDIQERLELFGSTAIIDRIALTWEQIEQYNPPPNPAKTTDARYEKYREQYGDDSWELDALEPQVMADLIRDAVQARIDQDYWQEAMERQQTGRDQLSRVSRRWSSVVDFLGSNGNGHTDGEEE
jgi:alkaline phosphatase